MQCVVVCFTGISVHAVLVSDGKLLSCELYSELVGIKSVGHTTFVVHSIPVTVRSVVVSISCSPGG